MPILTSTEKAEYDTLIAIPIDGLVLTELTTPKLSEQNIIGANAEATIWRDGSITGSSDNGSFTKWANGVLTAKYKAVGTNIHEIWTVPIVFISEPFATAKTLVAETSDYGAVLYSISTTTIDAFKTLGGTATPNPANVIFFAHGRWK